MSDNLVIPAGQIGTGAKLRTKEPEYQRELGGKYSPITPREQEIRAQEEEMNSPLMRSMHDFIPGMGDLPNEHLQVGSHSYEGKDDAKKNVENDLPLSVAMARVQSPDMDSYTYDLMTMNTNVPAGAIELPLLTVTISQGIRAVLKRVGWYTNNPGSAFLNFGLYLGNELLIPGGKYIGDQARPITQYNPSSLSVDFEDLAECHIPVEPDSVLQILVTNTDAVNNYPAWARMWGWHWEEESREDGRRAYYNTEYKSIM